MAQTAGSVVVEVGANTSNFDRAMARLHMGLGRLDRSADRANRSLGRVSRGAASATLSFLGLRGAVLAASGGFLGGAGLVYAMQKAIGVAINVEEQINKVGVVFGASGRAIINWSKTTATGIGLAQVSALEAVSTFGNMLRPLGIIPKQAATMSRSLVNLAGDMSSFNNASLEDTLLAIRAGLAGEVEPLRRFGVFLSDIRLKAEAMRSGFVGPGFKGVLDPLVKSLSAYNLILKDTKLAQGDYNRTQNSTANIIRTVKAQITDLAGVFGSGLEPVVNRVGRALRDKLADPAVQNRIREIGRIVGEKLMRAFERLGEWFRQNWPAIKDGFIVAGQALKVAADAAVALAAGLKQVADATPGGIGTLIAALAGYKAVGAFGGRGGRGGGGGGGRRFGSVGRVGAGFGAAAAFAIIGSATAPPSLREQQRRVSDVARVDKRAGMRLARDFNREFGTPLVQLLDNNPFGASGLRVAVRDPVGIRGDRDRPNMGRAPDSSKSPSKTSLTPIRTSAPLQTATGSVAQPSDGRSKSRARNEARKSRSRTAPDEFTPMTTLFGGPFLTGEAFSIASSFGYKAQPRDLLRDLRGQNAQLTTLVRSANRLKKRGAPQSLVSELLAGGTENADEAAALAGMNPKMFKQYLKAFGNRERLEERVNTLSVRSQNVTVSAANVYVGNAKHNGSPSGDRARRTATRVGQRRGGR